MTSPTSQTIEHSSERREFRLPAPLDGAVVRYNSPRPGVLDLFSTFVPPDLRGQGAARRLVTGVLDHVRANDLKIIPSCWYVAKLVDAQAEYQDLLA